MFDLIQSKIQTNDTAFFKAIGIPNSPKITKISIEPIIDVFKFVNNNEQNLEVSEENIESCLDTAGFGDVDLLIRTSGEVRLSNYLLWQNAYAEMFFTQTYWPDFNETELDDILSDFSKRERRFGGI